MNRSPLLKVISLFVVLVSIGFFFLIGTESSRQSIVSTQNNQKRHNKLWVQGVVFQSFKGRQIIARAVVKELKVNPRKFSIFNIKPLNELTLNNLTMEFYKSEKDPSGIELGDFIHKLSPGSSAKSSSSKRHVFGANGTGLITRAIINKLIFKIYNNNNLSLMIKSAKAYLNLMKGEVIFRNAVVADIGKKNIIKSRKIFFKYGENVLRVPGQYVLMSPAGSKKGNGLNINL